MPMAFRHWSFLYLLLTPLTWAGPASTGSLTPILQLIIPPCAQACLESFVEDNFPSSVCGLPPNFNCLCTSDSISDITLGEGALICLETNCPDVAETGALSVYAVCMTVPNAKPNTHKTLTATISSTTPTAVASSQAQTTSDDQSFTSSSDSLRSSAFSTVLSKTASGVDTAITSAPSPILYSSLSFTSNTQNTDSPTGGVIPLTTSSTSSTSSSASPTAAPASSPAPVLTKPQIAGVVVAGVGAAAVGFGLCGLIFCFRRRKSNRRNSGSSFGGDKVVGSEETTPDKSAIARRDFGHEHQAGLQLMPRNQRSPTRRLRLETPATSSEDGWGQYQRDMAPNETRLAAGPQLPRSARDEYSPITPSSNRTRNSQLLPDKPSYSLFPPPLRGTPRNSVPKQLRPKPAVPTPTVPPLRSPFTRAARQHPSSMDTSQAHLQSGNDDPNDPFTAPFDRSAPDFYSTIRESRPQPPPRSLRRDTPRFRIPSWEQPASAGVVRKPVPEPQPPRIRGTGSPPPPPIEPHYMAAIDDFHRRKPSRRRGNGPRPLTHYTSASETSFENSDDELDELPNPRSALSPLMEVRSPPVRLPGGRVSYPAIPISASESPTRKPNPDRAPHAPHPVRSDSLLSKRLGQDKAREIAYRLQGPALPSKEDERRNTAKYKILVSPGLVPIESSVSPASLDSVVRSPPASSTPTPWRR